MGVAWVKEDSSNIFFTSRKGTVYEHLKLIQNIVDSPLSVFLFEELNIFRNAKTTRNLLLKTGYIAYTLTQNPVFIHTMKPRKHLKVKNKLELFEKLKPYGIKNDNQSDAIAMLLYFLDKQVEDFTYELKDKL